MWVLHVLMQWDIFLCKFMCSLQGNGLALISFNTLVLLDLVAFVLPAFVLFDFLVGDVVGDGGGDVVGDVVGDGGGGTSETQTLFVQRAQPDVSVRTVLVHAFQYAYPLLDRW